MKIVCISDTHCIYQPKDLPDGDVLIHAGDLSLLGEIHEVQHALAWLRKFPHRYKFVIAGNHDNALAEMPYAFKEQFEPYKDRTPLIHLRGTEFQAEGVRFFGSSVLPFNSFYRPGARAYMLHSTTARHWGMAPNCDVLITHGPPKGILDEAAVLLDGEEDPKLGDPCLRAYVQMVKPKLHVFGHIHCRHGMVIEGSTTFVNAALINEKYEHGQTYEPIVVDI